MCEQCDELVTEKLQDTLEGLDPETISVKGFLSHCSILRHSRNKKIASLHQRIWHQALHTKDGQDLIRCLNGKEIDKLLDQFPEDPRFGLRWLACLIFLAQNDWKDALLKQEDFRTLILDTGIDLGVQRGKLKGIHATAGETNKKTDAGFAPPKHNNPRRPYRRPGPLDPSQISVEFLPLSNRARNILMVARVKTLGGLAKLLKNDRLIWIRGCGDICFEEITSVAKPYLELLSGPSCSAIQSLNEINDIPTILSTLTSREALFLALRSGVLDGDYRTLDRLAGMFGCSRENVRRIENKAIFKLSRLPWLKESMERGLNLHQALGAIALNRKIEVNGDEPSDPISLLAQALHKLREAEETILIRKETEGERIRGNLLVTSKGEESC